MKSAFQETPRVAQGPVAALETRLRALLSPSTLIAPWAPLARRTTLRVGGCAELLVEPADERDLAITIAEARSLGVPWRVIGRGSNLLVRDGGVRGMVLCLDQPAFTRIDVQAPLISCGAGVRLRDVAMTARREGLAGLEFLAGIPGSVGGALRMNAGAWSCATFERLERVRYMAVGGTIHERAGREVPFAYRRCEFFGENIALSAVFRGEPSTPEEVGRTLDDLNARRWATQPAAASAGCIFKNPPEIPAGRLIEELGLKGERVGAARVSEIHGNFIVNEGGATAADVLQLIELIRTRARQERGIELETEVEIIGE